MDYAFIVDSVVRNIVYLHPMNVDEFPNAVEINSLPVQIGDAYIDGKFYRNGAEVKLNQFENEPYGLSPDAVATIKNDAITEVEEAVINGTDE